MRGSWIFGVFGLSLLVALHWLAYRVGKSRRRAQALRRPSPDNDHLISRDPVDPK